MNEELTAYLNSEQNDIEFLQPVVNAGPEAGQKQGRGCPSKEISVAYLAEAMSAKRHITISSLARTLGMDRRTLRNIMKKQGIH